MKQLLKHIILLVFTVLFAFGAHSQDKRSKLLNRLYSQGYYQRVLKKSNKFIEKKGYKGDAFIHIYQVAALLKLQNDEKFMDAHEHMDIHIKTAINGWKMSPNYKQSIESELSVSNDLAEIIDKKEENKIVKTQKKVVKNNRGAKKNNSKDTTQVKIMLDTSNLPIEDKVIMCAETYLGIPYRYGGRDEDGFDCSGYTGYVLEQFGYTLPRSARDQEAHVEKIPIEEAKKGDLVFFSHRRNIIEHVGIVVSDKGKELTMIHASSSRGIIISNIVKSTYWKPRLRSAGRVIKKSKNTEK